MKVFPEEVEEAINSMSGIKESLVFGRDHPQYGQTAVAQVVLAGEMEDAPGMMEALRAHCCAKLSSYKVPVEFRAVKSLAKTASGKLVRDALSGFPRG